MSRALDIKSLYLRVKSRSSLSIIPLNLRVEEEEEEEAEEEVLREEEQEEGEVEEEVDMEEGGMMMMRIIIEDHLDRHVMRIMMKIDQGEHPEGEEEIMIIGRGIMIIEKGIMIIGIERIDHQEELDKQEEVAIEQNICQFSKINH